MHIDKDRVATKLLWIDLEMTGLSVERDVILEIAAEVTDFNCKVLGSYEAVIHHPDSVLEQASDWAKQQHGLSGLTDRVRHEGQPEREVVQAVVSFIQSHFGDEPAILAGNSIHNDRNFIKHWWPEVDSLLHYRMLDVSSWKILMQGKYDVAFEKQDVHRAFDDIHASMAELQYYLDWFKKNGSSLPDAAVAKVIHS